MAEEAEMKRSILRHYVGNREDMIHALAERVVAKYRAYLQMFTDAVTPDQRIEQLIGFFFRDQPLETTESVLVIEAMIAAGDQYTKVREMMLGYVEDVVSMAADQLRQAFPTAARQQCWSVAYGVISVAFNQESLTPLQLPPKYLNAARDCARRLIDSLK